MRTQGTGRYNGGYGAHPWGSAGRVIVVSNRGPIEFRLDEACRPVPGPGRGGMVTALSGVRRFVDVTWVAAALSRGDRAVARTGRPLDAGERCRLRLVDLPEDRYNLHYNVFSNPVLWYLQHGLWQRLERPNLWGQLVDAWERGYRPVNEALADAVCDELARPDSGGAVLFQDYHLYLAPRLVRECLPTSVLQHFVHIPWPGPEEWRALPWGLVRALCDGLLANDVVRFQTDECVRNFLLTCWDFLPGAHVDLDGDRVRYQGRWTQVRADPIALDVAGLHRRAASGEVRAYRKNMAAPEGVATIVRVDRLDPVKNVLAGFQAYDRLLKNQPNLRGRVRFLAFLVPTRTGVEEYRRYADEVFHFIDEVNGRHGSAGWQPIEVFYENNYSQALAGMSLHDVLLVNSLADGMNLVSLEGSIVNRRHGVLVLSTRAGSYHHLKDGALGVEPEDVEGTSEALSRALTLPAGERRRRARLLKKAASARDLEPWLQHQLDDLAAVAAESRRRHALIAMPEEYRVAVSA